MADTLTTQSTTLTSVAVTTFDIYKDASGNRFFPVLYITGGSADAWTFQAVDSSGHGLPVSLNAGTNIIGKVTTDQTTHGTTDLVAADITKVAGAAIAQGHGTAATAVRVELPTDGTGVVGLNTGTNAIGTVSAGGFTAVPTASKTRPSNVTAYSIGQVIAESTSAATVWTFTGCVRANGGTGTLIGVQLTDTSKQATTLQANLWLFSATPTVQNDAAAFAPSSGDLANLVAVVNLVNFTAANANGVLTTYELNRPFKCGAATTLYGVLVAANAYTPTSGEVFGITLLIGED